MRHKIPVEFIYTTIAVGGGTAKYIREYLAGEKFNWHILFANMLLSGFSGLMFALVGRSIGINGDYIFVFSGIGGFMSSSGLDYLAKKIKAKL